MPIDDESLADDVERMEQRRRDSLAFIRQRDAARVAGGEPIAGSAAADRHVLIAEVARLAEEVERLRADAESAWEIANTTQVQRDNARAEVERLRGRLEKATVYEDGDYCIARHFDGNWRVSREGGEVMLTNSGQWRAWHDLVDGDSVYWPSLDAAWAALDAARKQETTP